MASHSKAATTGRAPRKIVEDLERRVAAARAEPFEYQSAYAGIGDVPPKLTGEERKQLDDAIAGSTRDRAFLMGCRLALQQYCSSVALDQERPSAAKRIGRLASAAKEFVAAAEQLTLADRMTISQVWTRPLDEERLDGLLLRLNGLPPNPPRLKGLPPNPLRVISEKSLCAVKELACNAEVIESRLRRAYVVNRKKRGGGYRVYAKRGAALHAWWLLCRLRGKQPAMTRDAEFARLTRWIVETGAARLGKQAKAADLWDVMTSARSEAIEGDGGLYAAIDELIKLG